MLGQNAVGLDVVEGEHGASAPCYAPYGEDGKYHVVGCWEIVADGVAVVGQIGGVFLVGLADLGRPCDSHGEDGQCESPEDQWERGSVIEHGVHVLIHLLS